MAQSLSQHQWENRVILLFAPSFENSNLQKQLSFLNEDKLGLKDRKLIIYKITPNLVKRDNTTTETAITDWFEKFSIDQSEFTFVLIGLDGGEKMRSSEIVSKEKLFGIIDQMPMRRAERRKKQ